MNEVVDLIWVLAILWFFFGSPIQIVTGRKKRSRKEQAAIDQRVDQRAKEIAARTLAAHPVYQVADDLDRPLLEVVKAAERAVEQAAQPKQWQRQVEHRGGELIDGAARAVLLNSSVPPTAADECAGCATCRAYEARYRELERKNTTLRKQNRRLREELEG
jgi:hypothetical protein